MAYYRCFDSNWQRNKSWIKSSNLVSDTYKSFLTSITTDTKALSTLGGINNVQEMYNPVILAQIPIMYYDNYCTDIIDPALYLVRVDQKVAVEDGFNFNGTNYHVIICGTENES